MSTCYELGYCQECRDLGKDDNFDICKDGCVRDFSEKATWWRNLLSSNNREEITLTTREFNFIVWLAAFLGFLGGIGIYFFIS